MNYHLRFLSFFTLMSITYEQFHGFGDGRFTVSYILQLDIYSILKVRTGQKTSAQLHRSVRLIDSNTNIVINKMLFFCSCRFEYNCNWNFIRTEKLCVLCNAILSCETARLCPVNKLCSDHTTRRITETTSHACGLVWQTYGRYLRSVQSWLSKRK